MRTFFKYIFGILYIIIFTCNNISFAGNTFVKNIITIQLGNTETKSSQIGSSQDSLLVHKDILYRQNYDLISDLDNAKSDSERLNILNQYIDSISNVVKFASEASYTEQQKIAEFKKASSDCESQINKLNSDFSNAVKAYDYNLADSIANEIAELRACIAKNQVYIKAHTSYLSASNSLGNLQKKADYLSTNKTKIVEYYDILKPDLLKELYDISQTVNTNF